MAKAPKSLILNGPNLNMLGRRRPGVYGRATISNADASCRCLGAAPGMQVDCSQSNGESPLIDPIQPRPGSRGGLSTNPGAFSHTSIAILDALPAVAQSLIEGHISIIHRRETCRQQSYLSKGAEAVLCGLGSPGYLLALDAMTRRLNAQQET